MAYQEMTTWVNGPNGTKFALGLTHSNEIEIIVRRPSADIMSDTKVIKFSTRPAPEDKTLDLTLFHGLATALGLHLDNYGQVSVNKLAQE